MKVGLPRPRPSLVALRDIKGSVRADIFLMDYRVLRIGRTLRRIEIYETAKQYADDNAKPPADKQRIQVQVQEPDRFQRTCTILSIVFDVLLVAWLCLFIYLVISGGMR